MRVSNADRQGGPLKQHAAQLCTTAYLFCTCAHTPPNTAEKQPVLVTPALPIGLELTTERTSFYTFTHFTAAFYCYHIYAFLTHTSQCAHFMGCDSFKVIPFVYLLGPVVREERGEEMTS